MSLQVVQQKSIYIANTDVANTGVTVGGAAANEIRFSFPAQILRFGFQSMYSESQDLTLNFHKRVTPQSDTNANTNVASLVMTKLAVGTIYWTAPHASLEVAAGDAICYNVISSNATTGKGGEIYVDFVRLEEKEENCSDLSEG